MRRLLIFNKVLKTFVACLIGGKGGRKSEGVVGATGSGVKSPCDSYSSVYLKRFETLDKFSLGLNTALAVGTRCSSG